MNVLIACEESQRVCTAFREKGHNAFSCDIIECSGGHPEWHIKEDVLKILNPEINTVGMGEDAPEWYGIHFYTIDGIPHFIDGQWDLIIAHPPCTYLTNTGNRWFNEKKYGEKAKQRVKDRKAAASFFMDIWYANCDNVVIENPIGYMSTYFRKPDQIVHPYYFAGAEDDENCERKATCLWMRGVKPLTYDIKYAPRIIMYKTAKERTALGI